MSTLSQKIKKSLEEILEYKQGKKTLRTKRIEPPDSPLKHKSKEIEKNSKKDVN